MLQLLLQVLSAMVDPEKEKKLLHKAGITRILPITVSSLTKTTPTMMPGATGNTHHPIPCQLAMRRWQGIPIY